MASRSKPPPSASRSAISAAELRYSAKAFSRKRRSDGLWIVHGHVIAPEVRAEGGRIGTDTGAFATGRLSAVWLDRDGMQVLESHA
jgi:serine/threonine protein phosphatase 1